MQDSLVAIITKHHVLEIIEKLRDERENVEIVSYETLPFESCWMN